MGKMLFGHRETVTCIQDIPTSAPDGAELCLAYKTSGYFLVAGVYFHDDGYVLRPHIDDGSFYHLPPELLQSMQQEGTLPTPMPAYSIPWYEYAFGYSLWLAVLAVVAWGLVERRLKRRARERDDAAPVSHGPPEMRTDADRFVDAQVQPLLRRGESVQHQAYTLSGEPTSGGGLGAAMSSAAAPAHYAVLTSQRLLFIETRQGAFGPLLENKGVVEIERSAVVEVFRQERTIVLHARTASGPVARMLWVHRTGKLSNQAAFLRDVHRLLQADIDTSASASASASPPGTSAASAA